MSADQIGLWAGFILTLMVFSYVLGDNFLYRIGVYVFVGLSAGYVTVIAVEGVLIPWLNATLLAGDPGGVVVGLLPLILGLLLLFKTSGRLARIGAIGLAFLIGIGAAVALVGAISGTLIPLSGSVISGVQSDLLNGLLILISVICALLYFQFLARRTPRGIRRPPLLRFFGGIGQGVVTITLGALYGGALLTSLAILSERLAFVLTVLRGG